MKIKKEEKKVLAFIKKANKPFCITEIASSLGYSREKTRFYLINLEREGKIKSTATGTSILYYTNFGGEMS